ncbi:acyltransferase family protein [Paenibacillus donghaensis]|uniref:acyltransferase family protein n=1 Tax=Paenibacillus donghaensis TaxID=414771 RepID=UPI0018837995|nr:acyltransferase family protein [Paenibacillus donghaensis]MBE9916466.1 acyltransferase family protein [Paenibacillus donghaensis]
MMLNKRMYFLDNLKIFLTILVLAHHAGQPYGGSNGWWYFTTKDSPGLGAFFAVNAAFFMSLFFLISAYFVPASLERKGLGSYLRERFIRLGIPLIIGFFLLIPFSWPVINFGHLWFLQHLLIYSIIYAITQTFLLKPKNQNGNTQKPFPHIIKIFLFTAFVALITFIVRIWYPIDHWIGFLGFIQTEFAHVPQYVSFFIIGLTAAKHNWIVRIPKTIGLICIMIGFISSVILYSEKITTFQAGGFNIGSLQYSLFETFLCMGMCIGLIFLFQHILNKSSKLFQILSLNAFTVYIIHVPIVVILQYFAESIPVSAYFRFIFVIVLGILASFSISHFVIRKTPYLNKVF